MQKLENSTFPIPKYNKVFKVKTLNEAAKSKSYMERTMYTATCLLFKNLTLNITERILEIMKNFLQLRIKNFCKKQFLELRQSKNLKKMGTTVKGKFINKG